MGVRQNIANFIAPGTVKNSASVPMGQQFRVFGSRGNSKMSVQDFLDSQMSDADLYTGYNYAAIRKRANRTAQVAVGESLKTEATKKIMDAAKSSKDPIVHPYLRVIDDSPSFSNAQFWTTISTYLDIEGVFYLYALRNFSGNRIGDVQQFKLLNPFNITRVIKQDTRELAGYREVRDGLQRDIAPQQIIEIRELNPFDAEQPYSLIDASRDISQTRKQAGRYTRSSLSNNLKSPGILSSEVQLEQEDFENFKARVMGRADGEPIFGNGTGAVKWDPMNTDLDKAALDKINAMTVEETLAVTGLSKTMLGIEVSGVTRDTSETQSELFITSEIMPRIQLIIDALNQDYKNSYGAQYAAKKYRITLDSPLGADREAELKDIEVRDSSYNLYVTLVDAGYDRAIAAKFANGESSLEDLGEPKARPKDQEEPTPTRVTRTETPDAPAEPAANALTPLPVVRNAVDAPSQAQLNTQESSLRNAIINIEAQVVAAVVNHVTRNAYDSTADVLSPSEKKSYTEDLEMALSIFYGVVVPLYAGTVMSRRAAEFGSFGQFSLDGGVKAAIASSSQKAAASHIDTILGDLLKVVQEQALAGAGQDEMVRAIRREFADISKNRATAIARTETNRAFTMAQFEADKQFLTQNELTSKAFKKWVVRSDNPCNFCLTKASEPPIPFTQSFASVGDVLTADYTKADGTKGVQHLPVNYEDVEAGNLHVNCGCIYQLIVEGAS